MITRFAPSPTGPLHLGHAFSAILAHDLAQASEGRFLLRIEDIDHTRAKPEWEALIYEDLHWLGLTWEEPAIRQSDRTDAYMQALEDLWDRGLLYPCHCNRKDIQEAISAPQEGVIPVYGPDGIVYPGTCAVRLDRPGPKATLPSGVPLRLDMSAATANTTNLSFTETGASPARQSGIIPVSNQYLRAAVGDIVLSRKDFLGSYHLSVVLDDALQGVTDVIRGQDLFEATKIHVLLQNLLGLPTPIYHHHRLIRDESGKRLAKRDDARAIRQYRADGFSPKDIRAIVGLA